MPGLDPGILFRRHKADRRDKPGDDDNVNENPISENAPFYHSERALSRTFFLF